MSILNASWTNARGNVAIMFALAAIPLAGAVGAAVDYSRIADIRTELADALDAALLAVGSQPAMDDEEARAFVRAWFDGHMAGSRIGDWRLDSVTVDGGTDVQDAEDRVTVFEDIAGSIQKLRLAQ